jgi:hypothetical protein
MTERAEVVGWGWAAHRPGEGLQKRRVVSVVEEQEVEEVENEPQLSRRAPVLLSVGFAVRCTPETDILAFSGRRRAGKHE